MDIKDLQVAQRLLRLLLERPATDEARDIIRRIASRELTPHGAIQILEALDEQESSDNRAH